MEHETKYVRSLTCLAFIVGTSSGEEKLRKECVEGFFLSLKVRIQSERLKRKKLCWRLKGLFVYVFVQKKLKVFQWSYVLRNAAFCFVFLKDWWIKWRKDVLEMNFDFWILVLNFRMFITTLLKNLSFSTRIKIIYLNFQQSHFLYYNLGEHSCGEISST